MCNLFQKSVNIFFLIFFCSDQDDIGAGFGANGSQKGAVTEVFLGGQIMTSTISLGIYYV